MDPAGAEGNPFPGGIGVSRLRVYDTRAPDGLVGGSPHVHLCCSEGYLVLSGEGAVATLTGSGYQETPLTPGAVVWFTPGTIHRLVNHGDLEIIVLMQNSGLPEAGDAVLTFPPDILGDSDRYAAAMALPGGGAPGTDLTATYERRDLAVEGFAALRHAVDDDGPAALSAFYSSATALVRPRLDDWRRRWHDGARAAAANNGTQLDALDRGDLSYLAKGELQVRTPHRISPPWHVRHSRRLPRAEPEQVSTSRHCSRVLSPRIGGAMPCAHEAPLVSSWMKDRAQELAFACG